jgi:hypothetical protein
MKHKNLNLPVRTFVIFLFAVSVISCHFPGKSSEKKAEKTAALFLEHLSRGEYAKASEYATDKTGNMLEFMDQLVAVAGQKPAANHAVIVMCGCEVKSNEAVCNYTSDGKPMQLNLVKLDGEWKAELKKENPASK